jgi:hypothetical protein
MPSPEDPRVSAVFKKPHSVMGGGSEPGPGLAIAAAEAWAIAEAEGRTLKDGQTLREVSLPKEGKERLIRKPREHFAAMFGVGALTDCLERRIVRCEKRLCHRYLSKINRGSS